ncbi:hypothetical protein PVK06_034399 [Gossypium arboreum]|uniref:Uncharacterized protein n=1 Tax=Gossypium arboreum TaxID=29729 RepID=A0ABR0NEN0_GOSAR|nr:hypothetical protein PVK06_034399 [Gossypium arboreum]
MATWSDSDSSNSDEDNKVANLCLIAIEEPKHPAPKCARGESCSTRLDHHLLIECFVDSDALKKFNTYFATHAIQISPPVNLNFLTNTLQFKYLNQLRDWGWLECLQLRGLCYENLVLAFYSNTKLKHNLNTHLVQSITSSIMGKEITISVEILSSYLSITNKGDEHHTDSYDTSLTKPNDYVGYDIDIHDHILHLISTWIIAPTNKHSGFHHTDYWI